MDKRTEILEYSLRKVPQRNIAQALGVSESYISQVVNSDEFKELLAIRAAPENADDFAIESDERKEDDEFDRILFSTQNQLLKRIASQAQFLSFDKSASLLKMLNGLKSREEARGGRALQEEVAHNTINVNVIMPVQRAVEYIIDKKNQIIEVEGKHMLTATATQVEEMANAKNKSEEVPPTAKEPPRQKDRALELLSGPYPVRANRDKFRKVTDLMDALGATSE